MPSKQKILAVQKSFIKKYGGLCFFLIPHKDKNGDKVHMEPAMCPIYQSSPDCWYNEKRGLDQWLSAPNNKR
jgi:hypothetical protein